MDITEIIERLKNIAEHAVHTIGERPFIMSLDDGIAVHEAIELLEKTETNHPEIPDSWIPVTPDTMPEKNRVVVVCGEKGTWDYGTYRGHLNSINNWNWKKNTVKTVYWWMYKEDALPMPWEGEADEQN